ncbi:hypothetical protein ACQ4PT_052548 [Festuca glaucescens]
MVLLRPHPRPVRARHRRPDLLRSSSSAATETRSSPLAVTSLRACWLSAGVRPSALAPPILPAPSVAAGCIEDPALQGVDEFLLDAPSPQMPAAPAAALADAAAMLAHRGSDPAFGGRMVRRSPRPKPATAATRSSPICPVSFARPCDADGDLDSSSSSRLPSPPLECRSSLENEMEVVLETAPGSLLASPRAAPPASNAALVNGMAGSQQPPSCCFQGNGDWWSCFASSPGHSSHIVTTPPPQLDPPVATEHEAGHGWEFSGSNRPIITRTAPPAWLRDRCFRCLSKGHQVHVRRNPIRCMSCLQFSHIAHYCYAKPCIDQSPPL